MQFAYAAESLTRAGARSRLGAEGGGPGRAEKEGGGRSCCRGGQDCIRSLGAQATADNIQALLSPEIIPAAEYKKWWDGAKRALKKNGHFYVPGKKNEALRQLDAPSAMGDSALEHLRLANGPKAVLTALAAVSKYWPEIKSESGAE